MRFNDYRVDRPVYLVTTIEGETPTAPHLTFSPAVGDTIIATGNVTATIQVNGQVRVRTSLMTPTHSLTVRTHEKDSTTAADLFAAGLRIANDTGRWWLNWERPEWRIARVEITSFELLDPEATQTLTMTLRGGSELAEQLATERR